MVGNKVMGTIEGFHYNEDIWKAMSNEQRDKVVQLCKVKSAGCAVKAATTATAGTVPADVSDQLQMLTRAVRSLDSSRDGGCQSTDHCTSSRQCGERSRSQSSSHSHSSHLSGAHAGHRKH